MLIVNGLTALIATVTSLSTYALTGEDEEKVYDGIHDIESALGENKFVDVCGESCSNYGIIV